MNACASDPPNLRERPRAHWMVANRSVSDWGILRAWLFNVSNGGPVPDMYQVGAIVIGWGRRDTDSNAATFRCYFELSSTKVRRGTVQQWFPGAWVSPRYDSAQHAYGYICHDNLHVDRGAWSWQMRPDGVLDAWSWIIEDIQSYGSWSEVCADPNLEGLVANRRSWTFRVFMARPHIDRPLDMTAPGMRWQKRVYNFLSHTVPDDDLVIYVWEPLPNRGQSRFCQCHCEREDWEPDSHSRSPVVWFKLRLFHI